MTHRQARIVREHRAAARQDRRTARAPQLHIRARRCAGDPLRRAIGQSGASVQTHRQLDANPWPAALDAAEETAVEFARSVAHQAGLHGNASAEQSAQAFAGNPGIRIVARCNDSCDARRDQRVGARRRAAEVRARLQRHVDRRSARARAGVAQRKNFGMRFARALVPAFADDGFSVGNDAADARIRLCAVQAAFGQAQRARHVDVVRRGKRVDG